MTNTLHYGDNLHVLREHVADESVDLIYLDPPFNSNANYNILFKSPEGQDSDAQIVAFEDTWHWNDAAEDAYGEVRKSGATQTFELLRAMRGFLGDNDMMAYLAMMAVRLIELHRVLKPTGSLYLHCDPTASHYLKLLLDGVFGPACYQSEISWKRSSAHKDAKQGRASPGSIRDTIFFYTKSPKEWTWNWLYIGDYPLATSKSICYILVMPTKAPTFRQFQDRFPTEESCLEHLKLVRFGKRHDCGSCGVEAKFYRVKKRRSYACEHCGHQVYPTAGTPFHRTRTALRDWFHVMFLFTTLRNGVAAKEVERQIGVTYKTAWRMCHEIRKYMAIVDGDEPMGGPFKTVEVDETFVGGYKRGGQGGKGKSVVLGMRQRNGDIVTRVVADRKSGTLLPQIVQFVKPHSEIHTDELISYGGLGTIKGYWHKQVNHSAKQYVDRMSGATVNGIEGFWAQLKRGINGTHIHVSGKHLPKYLGEFEFRHNRRDRPETMLSELMTAFQR